MDVSRRGMIALGAGAMGACASSNMASGAPSTNKLLVDQDREPDFSIDLWPDGPPGGENVTVVEEVLERENSLNLRDRALLNITRPRLDVFRPENPDDSVFLIAPGGGYSRVVVDKEGYECARWLNRRGATVYVLFYRLPHQGWAAGSDTPLQDAQRAMRIIRARAGEDRTNPENITLMGFSAGGHLAGSLATRFAAKVYEAVDEQDAHSARPDKAALIYPVVTMRAPYAHEGSRINLIGENPSDALFDKYSIEVAPPANTPPVFLLHTVADAAVPVENATGLFAALKAAGVPTALHVFTDGPHGFGLRGVGDLPVRRWPELLMDWATHSA